MVDPLTEEQLYEERFKKYFNLIIGYIGLLLTGLATLQFVTTFHDTTSRIQIILGFMLVMTYFSFSNKGIGTTKVRNMFRIIFIGVFVISSWFLYF
ncbi:hypothetical protein SAMN05216389_11018 [Oceanobacillus limi]|uniref:Uncharacterized protein n=1 Tax=Oceanobacillus limi TaxID=930131 RepID=A0A1I0DZ84_9BACI|nr:hypothetical protein [Oceanobacillus limi]SET37911.1 hypothetical protein SAMN05216389_11018 [Oceanobacillus limi]